MAIDEELGTVGVLLIDRKHARYFIMDIEGIEETVDMFHPLSTRAHRFHSGGRALKGAQGSFKLSMPSRKAAPNMVQHSFGEYRFNMRIKSEWHAMLKLASDALFEDWKERKFDKLVIGGFLEEGLREIENHLHSYLRERLVGYIDVNPKEATPALVREKVLDLLKERDRQEEAKLLEELKELQGKGLAVNGTEKVLNMLAMGNIKTLLVAEDFEISGYLCLDSHLPSLKPECPMEGEQAIQVSDIVDEIIEEALQQRAKVEIVVSEEVRKDIEGLAALLRFKV
jgi:peptide chain release factor subunit 1